MLDDIETAHQDLITDPENAEAYIFLAENETDENQAIFLFERSLLATERTLGKEFLIEAKGTYWGIFETRPYMRAKAGLADCYMHKNQLDKVLSIYEEMLVLNPNDNQGIRYLLSTILLKKKMFWRYDALIKTYKEDVAAYFKYNDAICSFMKTGKSSKTNKALEKAYTSNEYVIEYLLGYINMPQEMPDYMSFGDSSEAVNYVSESWQLWTNTKGALDWLSKFRNKSHS